MTSRPHALYRFFDAAGDLLYVGITLDPGSRWKQHRDDKAWWHEVARVELENHPSREAVLAAEKAAIITEQPRYNIVHNRGRRLVPVSAVPPAVPDTYDSTANLWTFRSRYGYRRTTDLSLAWEVNGTPMTDDYVPEEISASTLMNRWLGRYGKADPSIFWLVLPVAEAAPFQPRWLDLGDFLSYYTWPINQYTGERLNWNRLPVAEPNWTDAGDKGGFFHEVTGWKPAPLQERVPLRQVLRAAGLADPFTTSEEHR